MSITFGSFGDIVAAVQVGYKLVQVLDSQKGAKAEFNELLVELRLFSGLLELLVKQWPTRRECPALKELYDVLQPAVREVKGEIDTCLEGMINKYGRSMFAPDNERRGAKDIAKLFQWHVLDKSSATKLSEKVKTCRGVIQVIQGQANMIVEEHDSTVLAKNLTALKKAESDAACILDERLCTLENKVENQYGYLTSIGRIVNRLGAVINPMAIEVCVNIPTTLSHIYELLITLSVILRNPNPYAENSVLLEDALGYTVQLPLEWINSVDAIRSILSDRFRNRHGQMFSENLNFALLSELQPGRFLDETQDFSLAVRPGQRLVLCMVHSIEGQGFLVETCPACLASNLYFDYSKADPKWTKGCQIWPVDLDSNKPMEDHMFTGQLLWSGENRKFKFCPNVRMDFKTCVQYALAYIAAKAACQGPLPLSQFKLNAILYPRLEEMDVWTCVDVCDECLGSMGSDSMVQHASEGAVEALHDAIHRDGTRIPGMPCFCRKHYRPGDFVLTDRNLVILSDVRT